MATKQKEVKLSKRTKRCNRHNGKKGADLSIDLFPNDRREKDGKSVWCKACWKEYHDSRKAIKASGKPAGQKVAVKAKVTKGSTKPVKATAKVVKSAKAQKTAPEVSQQ